MASVQDLISAAQPPSSGGANAGSVMAAAGFSPDDIAQAHDAPETTATPSSGASRVGTGLMDPVVGIGQDLQHVLPDKSANALRHVPPVGIIGAMGLALRAAGGGKSNASTEDVDQAVAQREKDYQAGRTAAGSVGFDWLRTAGDVANPVNYAIPSAGAESVAGRIAGAAAQGAGTGLMQPSTQPGNLWGDKLKQGGLGALVGGAFGTGIEALSKPLSWASSKLTGLFKDPAAANAAAAGVIDKTLEPTGIKATDLPPEMVDGLADQVKHSIKTGDPIDPVSIHSQAEAASLPVPIKLPRGQASGDAGQYATEQELAKQIGKGDELRTLMTENNSKLISNVDAIGAKGAPSAAEAGTQSLTSLARIDQTLDQAKNAAYNAVKDSKGRSAPLDTDHFYVNATDALKENMSGVNNTTVLQHLDDIASGKLPLNVDSMVKLDKAWGRIQRTTADGNEAYGIGLLRRELNNTPVTGDAGQEAVAAYQKARGLAKAQFDLADPKSQKFIPAYASMVKGMGDASHNEFISALQGGTANVDPEKWFNTQVMNATPAAAKKLMGFVGSDAGTTQTIRGATLGGIKDQVVKGNSDVGRTVFSNDAMRKVMDREDTLRQILPSDTVDTLGRLYNTSSRISGVPYKSPVNWSNTSAANANLATAKEAASTLGRAAASLHPATSAAMAAKDVVSDLGSKRAQRAAAQAATQPLYTTPGVRSTGALKKGAYAAGVPLSALLGSRDDSQ